MYLCFLGGWFRLAASMHNWFYVFVDWLALPSLAFLAGVLIFRNQQRQFPLFFFYVIVAELVGLTRLAASGAPVWVYSYVYWISDIILVLFSLSGSLRTFREAPLPRFLQGSIFSLSLSGDRDSGEYSSRFDRNLWKPQKTSIADGPDLWVFACRNLIFFVALMAVMGRQWGKREFGIAAGFGLDASTSLAALAILSHVPIRSAVLNRLAVIAYDLACLIWLYCFWSAPSAQASTASPALSAEALQEARKWEDSLKDFMSQGKG